MPKMKLSSFLFVCNENNLDVDVYTDYTDDLAICYCGDEEFGLTEEGRKEFSAILDLDVEWTEGQSVAVVLINDKENAEELNDLLVKFFNACAGYVSDSLYNKWFTFE